MARILLVDDDPAMLVAVSEVLCTAGHETVLARSAGEALPRLDAADLVIADYAMPGQDGLALLRLIRERDEAIPVVILTAQGSSRVAVQAIKGGAYDYVEKPFDCDELVQTVARAAETRALRVENRRLAVESALGKAIVGTSAGMRRLLADAERVAAKDVTVLVSGETGTGKEMIASLIHARSRRAGHPLVRFNCAAIPQELAEAELFGHTRGAYTGATEARAGFFAEANGGTLVLDEVGELSPSIQAKLLRVLQEGEIQPVGSGRVERVDVRVIACTNASLVEQARAGRFRADLYYRLAVVELTVPPLRARREDISALANAFVRRYSDRFGMERAVLSRALVDRLVACDWPGNVRQLENAIARLLALSPGGEIGADAFVEPSGPEPAMRSPSEDGPIPPPSLGGLTLREHLDAVERGLVQRAIDAAQGNQSEAARRLGLSRSSFLDRLKKYGIDG